MSFGIISVGLFWGILLYAYTPSGRRRHQAIFEASKKYLQKVLRVRRKQSEGRHARDESAANDSEMVTFSDPSRSRLVAAASDSLGKHVLKRSGTKSGKTKIISKDIGRLNCNFRLWVKQKVEEASKNQTSDTQPNGPAQKEVGRIRTGRSMLSSQRLNSIFQESQLSEFAESPNNPFQ